VHIFKESIFRKKTQALKCISGITVRQLKTWNLRYPALRRWPPGDGGLLWRTGVDLYIAFFLQKPFWRAEGITVYTLATCFCRYCPWSKYLTGHNWVYYLAFITCKFLDCVTSDLGFILYLQGLPLIIINTPLWNTPICTSTNANFPLVFPTPLLVHLEVNFLFHWWYYFFSVLNWNISCLNEALNYFKFLPDEALSSNLWNRATAGLRQVYRSFQHDCHLVVESAYHLSHWKCLNAYTNKFYNTLILHTLLETWLRGGRARALCVGVWGGVCARVRWGIFRRFQEKDPHVRLLNVQVSSLCNLCGG
jgi:hypothetical protein